MTREVVTVTEDTSIVTVAELLHRNSFHALPVVDAQKKLVGIVTETDFFLKDVAVIYLPAYAEIIQKQLSEDKKPSEEMTELETLSRATTRDIMTEQPITVSPEANLTDIISLVRAHHFKTFPVIDNIGGIVGVVTIMDVIATIGKQTRLQEVQK